MGHGALVKRKTLRVGGHKLTLEWSGEYGVESTSTGTCRCGWTESASSQDEVRNEYRFHLRRVLHRKMVEKYELTMAQDILLDTIRDWQLDGGFAPQGNDLRVARELEKKGLVKVGVVGEMWKKGWYYQATVTESGDI